MKSWCGQYPTTSTRIVVFRRRPNTWQWSLLCRVSSALLDSGSEHSKEKALAAAGVAKREWREMELKAGGSGHE